MDAKTPGGGSVVAEVLQDGEKVASYSNYDSLYKDILSGAVTRNQKARKITYVNAVAKQGGLITIKELAKSNFKTRCLYEPLRAYAMKGLLIGWLVGFILKALDTALVYFQASPGAGLVWIIFVGSILLSTIPKFSKANWVAFGIGLLAIYLRMGNVWFGAISVGIVSFLGAAPFGMAVGTIVGQCRKRKLPAAPDAEPEGARAYVLGLVLPVLGGTAFILLYIFWLNPLIINWLAG